MGFVGHHLIQFTREALRGEQNASFYSAQTREPALADANALRSLRQSPRVASQARNFI
jgi:hypothetical protein